MRYNIEGFDQENLIKNNITLKETYILRYIVTIFSLENSIKKTFNNEIYCWIKYQSLLDEYPILDIPTTKKLGLVLKAMQKKGILKLKLDMNPLGTFTYIKYNNELFLNLITKSPHNYIPIAENEFRGVQKRSGGVNENVQGGCTKMGTHNILLLNNNHITKEYPLSEDKIFDENENKKQINKNIIENWKIIFLEIQQDNPYARFTNREWKAIEDFAISDNHKNKTPHLIKADLLRLIDSASSGLDIKEALLQSMSYKSLMKPKMFTKQNDKGKFMTLQEVQEDRFKILNQQLQENNFYNQKI